MNKMSGLRDLIGEAKGECGRYYYSKSELTGYRLLAETGFKRCVAYTAPGWLEVAIGVRAGVEAEFNEAVVWKDLTTETTKKRRFRKDLVETVPVETQDRLEEGTENPAAVLIYVAARKEQGFDKRCTVLIQQGLVSTADIVGALGAALRNEPGNAGMIFQGAFPELEQRYHVKPNGNILIASLAELSSDNAAEFVRTYST
jgi:hypothetical protein